MLTEFYGLYLCAVPRNIRYIILPVSMIRYITVCMLKDKSPPHYQRCFCQTSIVHFKWYKRLFSLNIISHRRMYMFHDYHCRNDSLYSALECFMLQSWAIPEEFWWFNRTATYSRTFTFWEFFQLKYCQYCTCVSNNHFLCLWKILSRKLIEV